MSTMTNASGVSRSACTDWNNLRTSLPLSENHLENKLWLLISSSWNARKLRGRGALQHGRV